ncbi:peptide alpha-N-acetyltransferase complex A subunit NAT1 NDAI_0A06770 [Naumovozyma dairenensis CBS 421]|uniref:Uncharacterized protein n=1 Tax=Naumovozyma dairenensis (strain ATCC 10597 / BCRC 20456 / CBS 421 / NBRC 0211 / NRRL Y-12639) TaxID=1071378 RepID=G0W4U3_NAUDC|nr:hypothetical protein NDAI_0A06770 [Naumovozyma dairenensis CBS 421]CCD22831.1 hypothetical protein NDAI_0A06770 [Naumovozyma dairenensis CBS 421]
MSARRRGGKAKAASKLVAKKDTGQFIEALKLYENKEYKKSIKILDVILKKSSSNTDSLVLKGANLFALGEKDEAAVLIKNALGKIEGTKASSICCHLLGIYMRQVKDYAASIKWFQACLANGSNNNQIYRDLATLQSQTNDFKGALVSRKEYWESYPGYRANWTSLAVAQDINGERQQAINTLSQFEKLAEGKIGPSELYEHNECLMYKNDIMFKAAGGNRDKLQNVLKHLNVIEPNVFDKFGLLERKASIYMKMGQFKDASIVYRTLIKRNPDNFNYYPLLEISLGIRSDNKLRKALYGKLQEFYPNCEPPKYLPLTFIQDKEELSKNLEKYVTAQLQRGVPAAFSNLKPLYKKRGKIVSNALEEIVLKYFESLNPKSDHICYIWTGYYLAQHYLFLKDLVKAQHYIDTVISHTPTLVELYILKARIFKHLGLLDEAASILEEGRQLDLQDRFINCKTVKYFLRANKIDKAVDIASVFTKNDDAPNGIKDLHFVEASWFIVEQAEAYYRLHINTVKGIEQLPEDDAADATKLAQLKWDAEKYKGLALKRFYAISKFYKQFEDDQLDFHSYCMRKGTPRAYLEMLQWGNSLYTKPIYVRAMEGASKIYFDIFSENSKIGIVDQDSSASSANYKKVKKESTSLRRRKEEEKKIVAAYGEDQDRDVFGEVLINTEVPLEEFASNFYDNYCKQVNENEKDFVLEFEYQYKAGKLVLCFSALTKYAKKYGIKNGMFGAMAIMLLLGTRDSITTFETIAKKVVLKGFETDFANFPIHERENENYDWLTFFEENYSSKDFSALLYFRRNGIFDPSRISSIILDRLSNYEPYVKDAVLQYEL